MRKRKRPTELMKYINADGHTVTVFAEAKRWIEPQPMRSKAHKMKRTSKVYDPHVSQRPVTQVPARLV